MKVPYQTVLLGTLNASDELKRLAGVWRCVMSFRRFSIRRRLRHHVAYMLALFFSLTSAAQAHADSGEVSFNPIGTNRIIFVCLTDLPDEAAVDVSQTYDRLDWDGFAERHLLVFEVQDTTLYLVQRDGVSWRRVEQSGSADALRRRANCRGDLDFVLIGKDGGEKMRWQESLPRRPLFDTIDAMPMRQYEMRQNAKR